MTYKLIISMLLGGTLLSSAGAEKTEQGGSNQALVAAAFHLDIASVRRLIDAGADVDATYGQYDENVFRDHRFLGFSPIGSQNWTPLLAVANSEKYPPPEKTTDNTVKALDQARRDLEKIPKEILDKRNDTRLAIAKLLISAGAEINIHDGWGSTPLASAVYKRYDRLALYLIEKGARADTQTGIYIDGPAGITPLHRATGRTNIMAALISAGADVNAAQSDGETPLHWAARDRDTDSIRLLIKAGATITADKEGKQPGYWVRPFGDEQELKRMGIWDSKQERMKEVRTLLMSATNQNHKGVANNAPGP